MIIRLFSLSTTLALLCSCAESSRPESTEENSPTPPPGMALIPGGSYQRGGDAGEMDSGSASHQSAYPIHEVHVDAFWIDETEVTNRQFHEFVEATGYVTFAERAIPKAEWQELQEEAKRNLARLELIASQTSGEEREQVLAAIKQIQETSSFAPLEGSMIFSIPKGELSNPDDLSQWWRWIPGATWRTPAGPGTTLEGLDDHPVVNVTYEDAAAYAAWAGKRLPTEAEWEKAGRGGLEGQPYAWGSEMFPRGEGAWMANIWQGEWPHENSEEDGFYTTAPVKSFPPNGYGLHDMAGNVWELVSDVYHPSAYTLPSATLPNSTGPSPEEMNAPNSHMDGMARVTKGGSFLCSDSWCKGYQPGSRDQLDPQSPSNHTGFRCAMDVRKSEGE